MLGLVALLLTLASAPGCATPRAVPAIATADPDRALVLRFHDALNRQDWALLDSLVAPDYRHFVVSATGFRALTWADVRRGNLAVRGAFPDWVNTPVHVLSDSGRVSVLLVGRGTHSGSLGGETPTGRTAVLPIALVHEVRGGRIVADWEVADTGPLMRSLTAATDEAPAVPSSP